MRKIGTTRVGFWFVLMAVLLVQAPLWAQSDTTLLATTDLDCTWKLDGKLQGNLKADDSTVVPITLGKHLIQATSTDGLDKWRAVVNVKQAGQEMVEIKLKETHERRVAKMEPAEQPATQPASKATSDPKSEPAPKPISEPATTATQAANDHATKPTGAPTWTDPATGLMWTGKDNGHNVTWNQANDYCSELKLAGYSQWRLPTVNELAAIYDEAQNVDGWHIKGGIGVSGWEWTNSSGNSAGEHQLFTFHKAKKDAILVVYSKRALCVRQSAK